MFRFIDQPSNSCLHQHHTTSCFLSCLIHRIYGAKVVTMTVNKLNAMWDVILKNTLLRIPTGMYISSLNKVLSNCHLLLFQTKPWLKIFCYVYFCFSPEILVKILPSSCNFHTILSWGRNVIFTLEPTTHNLHLRFHAHFTNSLESWGIYRGLFHNQCLGNGLDDFSSFLSFSHLKLFSHINMSTF